MLRKIKINIFYILNTYKFCIKIVVFYQADFLLRITTFNTFLSLPPTLT